MLASTLDEIIANCCSDSIVCVSVRFRYSGRICIVLIANTKKIGSIPILGVSVVQVHISDAAGSFPDMQALSVFHAEIIKMPWRFKIIRRT